MTSLNQPETPREAGLQRRRETTESSGLGRSLGLTGAVIVVLGLFFVPPYYECRKMKERGEFWYGGTVKTCVDKRLAARNEAVESVAAKAIGRLR